MNTIELPFTTLEINDSYAIARTKEGVNVCMEDHIQVLEVLNEHLTSPYGFILDEVNSYSVDLHVMNHIRKDENIFCVGVVYYRTATKIALELGQYLVKKPVFFSESINDVTGWVSKQLAY